jgi:hypothetical protein
VTIALTPEDERRGDVPRLLVRVPDGKTKFDVGGVLLSDMDRVAKEMLAFAKKHVK